MIFTNNIKSGCVLTTCLFLTLSSSFANAQNRQNTTFNLGHGPHYFSLTVKSELTSRSSEVLELFQSLKTKGFPVYYTEDTKVGGFRTGRITIGRYGTASHARKFAQMLADEEGFDIDINDAIWFDKTKQYYSILLGTFQTLHNYEEFVRKWRQKLNGLDRKTHPVDYTRPLETYGQWITLSLGVYDSWGEAESAREELLQNEGLGSTVDTASVFVSDYQGEFKIVTLRDGIWYFSEDSIQLIFDAGNYSFQDPDGLGSYYSETKAVISPDGQEVVFLLDNKIVSLNIADRNLNILFDEKGTNGEWLRHSFPQWSPSGKYIAFMDAREWEVSTSLWVMNRDGTNARPIIDNGQSGSQSVKHFMWHPSRDEIFFVGGYTWGTVTVGGNLYAINLIGNRKDVIIVNTEKRQEVFFQFNIIDDKIIYQIAHFDENWNYKTYTKHELKLSDIK